MRKAYNYNEFKELIKKYQSITLSDIEDYWNKYNQMFDYEGSDIMLYITGFSNMSECILCVSIEKQGYYDSKDINHPDCSKCMYQVITGTPCASGINKKTFENISHAKSPMELLKAIKRRYKHMQRLLTEYCKEYLTKLKITLENKSIKDRKQKFVKLPNRKK